ncbi:MAG TPA: response regulator [Bryobacteraceae bacterium]|nr:response regulator [Bryobacteraceae bacterium]
MAPGTALSTILVVDDEPSIRQLVSSVLSASGYKVVEAETPEHALQIMSGEASVNLLVTDILMPDLNGNELARRLMADWPDLKVLFISGYEPAATVRVTGTLFLQKPFRVPDLLESVGQLLRHD